MKLRESLLAPFGAEIRGVSVASLPAGSAEAITETVSRHRIVVFRNQSADDQDFVDFLRSLGKLTFTVGETPVPGVPDLNVVSNVGRTTPPRSVFHTDTSYVPVPPAFSALRAVTIPAAGGETSFSDQVAAAARLPARVSNWLRGRTLHHSSMMPDGTPIGTRHPVLRLHPQTGETSLFLSTPERCGALDGVDEITSARIVWLLYRHSIRLSGLYQHAWRSGDIVIWDDRTTMHRAEHGGVVGDRVLHRGLITGEVPLPA